jgi:lysylphosphatidylglycerol synthetase-like protein (DUF2156 family)
MFRQHSNVVASMKEKYWHILMLLLLMITISLTYDLEMIEVAVVAAIVIVVVVLESHVIDDRNGRFVYSCDWFPMKFDHRKAGRRISNGVAVVNGMDFVVVGGVVDSAKQ